MFLIDSSVWIEYLRPKGSLKVKDRVEEILKREEAATCGIVIVELLRGAREINVYQSLKESLTALPQTLLDKPVIERAAEWGYFMDRKGTIIPTTDLLIGASAFEKATVFHCDKHFELLGAAFGLRQEWFR
jgi:predicted nucleic acid-binding protein